MTARHLIPDLGEATTAALIARRALRAGYFGYFVDMFEVYLDPRPDTAWVLFVNSGAHLTGMPR